MEQFYSNGKLLISGEYLVLDGANSLALPTKYGQSLSVLNTDENTIVWESYNIDNKCWFKATFNFFNIELIDSYSLNNDGEKIAITLREILITAKALNSRFLVEGNGIKVNTNLTFPNNWGLGTSSTLINNIASWANVNAFELLEKSFGGSGYDIACAQNDSPIIYQRQGIRPNIEQIHFRPTFRDQLFFVYLNQKQDSKEGIKMYRSLLVNKKSYIKEMSLLTKQIILAQTIQDFEALLFKHEDFLANVLKVKPVKEKLFSDFNGAVKSLGAWGGDFVLVTGNKEYVTSYFTQKKYDTIIAYDDMILN